MDLPYLFFVTLPIGTLILDYMKSAELTPRYPTLSAPEWEVWVKLISPQILGARVDRIFVPETKLHPEGYFKKEWVLELYSPHHSLQLYFSLRPQSTGLLPYSARYFKPSPKASRSGFDLSLSKALEGSRVSRIRAVPGERTIILEFKTAETHELHLQFIPSSATGVLLKEGILLSSTDQREDYIQPVPRLLSSEQLAKIPNRPELVASIDDYQKLWEKARLFQALQLRRIRLDQVLRSEFSSLDGKIRSLMEQFEKSEQEPDWAHLGALLQTHFYAKPVPQNGFYELMDYEKEILIKLPADPKLGLKEQLQRYFHLAKRNKKRLEETESRIEDLRTKKAKFESLKNEAGALANLDDFLEVEKKLGITEEGRLALKSKEQKKLSAFSGRQYQSKEGLTVLVGRNLAENLELTFKIARGNDIWLHVKGRPSAHAVILLPPKRSASLDTLLDAACLCILHSGGKEWGKTEVDYTQRKFVKKIKDQSEVSYTHNKTLVVTIDEERLKKISS